MKGAHNYRGHNKPGAIRVPEHAHPLVRRFINALNEQGTTYADVARRAGVGVDTLRFWPTRHVPRLDLFDAALNVLGLELRIGPLRPANDDIRRAGLSRKPPRRPADSAPKADVPPETDEASP